MADDWGNFIASFNTNPKNVPTTPGEISTIASFTQQGFEYGGLVGGAAALIGSSFATFYKDIGAGRKEADIIVPIQNQFGNLLAEVNRQKDDPNTTVYQLAKAYELVVQQYRQFDAFTRSPKFTDGRASTQARDTIRPLVDGKNDAGVQVREDGGTLGNIERIIVAKGGYAPGNVANGGKPGEPSTLGANAAGGANNGLLLAGGALVGAKLLGFF